MRSACEALDPVFDTADYYDLFEQAAQDGQWLAISLMTNAEREGDGATRLWSLAACCDDEHRKRLLKKHAVDESRHALAYLALLDLVFPGAATPHFRAQLDALSPRYAMDQPLRALEGSAYAHAPSTDDFVQMNIAEIRTSIHHLMQRAALERHCAAECWPRARKILDSLLRDELDHVGYTAVLLEEDASNPSLDLPRLYERRLQDFHDITTDELSRLVFD